MLQKVLFLGTGTSQGVPVIGCNCVVCGSNNSKDRRFRSSVLVTINSINILIDIGPDFRSQMLDSNISSIDHILITHQHRDHTAGIDDLRPIYYLNKRPISLYAENHVIQALKQDFQYIFNSYDYPGKPKINLRIIDDLPFLLSDFEIIPIRVMHHKLPIFGYRIGDLSYITDANYISSQEMKKLLGTKILIINSLQKEPHISHYNLQQSLELIEELNPDKAYLTHVSHNMGTYKSIQKELPENVFLAYDMLEIEI